MNTEFVRMVRMLVLSKRVLLWRWITSFIRGCCHLPGVDDDIAADVASCCVVECPFPRAPAAFEIPSFGNNVVLVFEAGVRWTLEAAGGTTTLSFDCDF
nr:hypothetical protein CFP56_30143 [Quercus suber]